MEIKEWIWKGLMAFLVWISGKVSAEYVWPMFKRWIKKKFSNKSIENLKEELSAVKSENYIINATLDAFFRIHKTALFVNNADMELIWVNRSWLDLTGFRDAEEAYGFGYLRAIPKEHHKSMREQAEQMKKHPSIYEDSVIFINVEDKRKIQTIVRAIPICNENNELVKVLGIVIITEKM
jgi:PAS domain-containing protein